MPIFTQSVYKLCLIALLTRVPSPSPNLVVADAMMEEVNGDERKGFHAPWFTVPKQHIVNVEHPFIINNVDKGLATLGNPRKLQEVGRSNVTGFSD